MRAAVGAARHDDFVGNEEHSHLVCDACAEWATVTVDVVDGVALRLEVLVGER